MRADTWSPTTPDDAMDAVIARSRAAAEGWIRRLDSLQGCHSVKEACTRIAAIGRPRLLKALSAIACPADREIVAQMDPAGSWAKSAVEQRIEARNKQYSRGRALVAVRSVEEWKRAKAVAQYFFLIGVHPADIHGDQRAEGLGLAWQFFARWKTCLDLARRAAGHREGRVFGSLAKAYRLLTVELLIDPPRSGQLKGAARAASRLTKSPSEKI